MADVDELHKYCNFENFESDIVVDTNHNLKHMNRGDVGAEEIAFTLHLTNRILKHWWEVKLKVNQTNDRFISYVEILNLYLAKYQAVLIKDGCVRIEERLRRIASNAVNNSKGKRGRKYVEYFKQSISIALRSGELLKAGDMQKELDELKAKQRVLEQDNDNLQQHCNDIAQSLVLAELQGTRQNNNLLDAQDSCDKLRKENTQLWNYMDRISEQEGFVNCGKPISDVKGRQQRRKIRELKTSVEKAFWFAETLGLKLSTIELSDKDGMLHTIKYESGQGKKSYSHLSKEAKIKVKQVLYITDTFCIGEAAYHQLAMTPGGGGLPRPYLVK